MRLLPRRSGMSTVRSSNTRTKPGASPRGEQSTPSAPHGRQHNKRRLVYECAIAVGQMVDLLEKRQRIGVRRTQAASAASSAIRCSGAIELSPVLCVFISGTPSRGEDPMSKVVSLMLDGQFEPVSHYAHGTRAGDRLWISGMVGIRLDGTIPEDTAEQFDIALAYVDGVLRSQGGRPQDIAKVQVFMTDIADRARIQSSADRLFRRPPPGLDAGRSLSPSPARAQSRNRSGSGAPQSRMSPIIGSARLKVWARESQTAPRLTRPCRKARN